MTADLDDACTQVAVALTAQAPRVVADDLDDDEFRAHIERPATRSRAPRGETAVTADVLAELNGRPGHRFQKMHQGSHSGSGEPDLDGCVFGRCVKIEMKAGDNRPTAKQHRRLLQWQEAGALVGWARSADEVDEILARRDDPHYRYDGQSGAPAPDAPPAPEEPCPSPPDPPPSTPRPSRRRRSSAPAVK